MKSIIESHLTRLQEAVASAKNGKIRVTFGDGHTEYLTGGECIDLWYNSDPDVVEFYAPPGSGHGLLPELLTSLLNHRKDD